MLALTLEFIGLFSVILLPLIPRSIQKPVKDHRIDRSMSDYSVAEDGCLVPHSKAEGMDHSS